MQPLRQTILIIEDDVPLRQMFRIALGIAGFNVREVGDGYAALQSLEDDPPDLVVLDLGLPVVSGYVVRAELAARAHTRQIPVVIVTGEENPVIDADCVLSKPVTPDQLVQAVRRCMASGIQRGVGG